MSQNTDDDALVIPATEAVERFRKGATLIDVRSENSKQTKGLIDGAISVDKTRLPDFFSADSPEFITVSADKDAEIIVVCGSINGSRPVAEWLSEQGYTNIHHVDGGYEAILGAQSE